MKYRYPIFGLVLVALAFPSAASAQGDALPETFTVDARSDAPQFTDTVLDAGNTYFVVATGTSSVWGDESGVIDALYCFESQRCEDRGTIPVRFPKLQFNDKGLDELAGNLLSPPAYEADHRYEVEFTGVSGQLKLTYSDENYTDNSGSYQVTIGRGGCPGLLANPDANFVEGTDGNDSNLDGTPGDDVICGYGGDDVIDGKGGEDVIFSGGGDDIAEGGGENDVIHGDKGDDQLIGGGGNDFLRDEGDFSEENFLDGGPGDDELGASHGNNRFRGGAGDDTLLGGDGVDKMRGEGGSDRLEGGGNRDRLFGGPNGRVVDILSGGPDADRLFGQGGADLLAGDGGGDRLFGGRNGDDLDGGLGRDRFYGQRGPDTLLAKDGVIDRRLDGGRGIDLADFDRAERRKLRSVERR